MISIDENKLKEVVSSFQIPPKPELLTKIQQIMATEEPDMSALADIIAKDVGISSAILKIINSPCYGMNRKISEIKQAVMILGLNTINGLVTALLLKESIKGKSSISLERFWDDALDVANAMTFLGNKVKNKVPVDMLYTVGLFHDCGIPLIAIKYPNYKDVLVKANSNGENSVALENSTYGTNHPVIGYFVAASWNLPKNICDIILRHHDEQYLAEINGSTEQLIFAVLKAAENIVNKNKRHHYSPDWQLFSESVLDVLGISEEDYVDLEDDFAELL